MGITPKLACFNMSAMQHGKDQLKMTSPESSAAVYTSKQDCIGLRQ